MAINLNLINNNTTANITTNFQRVKAALQEAIGRDGTLPNHMTADLDMDGNDLINVNLVDAADITINGQPIGISLDVYIREAERFAELSEDWSNVSEQWANESETSAGISAANRLIAQEAALEAHDLVQEATSGFVGFTDGLGYDFGSITSPITYFNQDWGTLV